LNPEPSKPAPTGLENDALSVERGPSLFLRLLPFLIPIAVFTAWAGTINSLSILECNRTGQPKVEGECTLLRGSQIFNYTETFFMSEIVAVTVESQGSEVKHRKLDGGAERIYIRLKNDDLRFIDNNKWDRAKREAEANRMNAFLGDKSAQSIAMRFDYRLSYLVRAWAAGLIVGLLFFLARKRRSEN
jgi:hypothetical protein